MVAYWVYALKVISACGSVLWLSFSKATQTNILSLPISSIWNSALCQPNLINDHHSSSVNEEYKIESEIECSNIQICWKKVVQLFLDFLRISINLEDFRQDVLQKMKRRTFYSVTSSLLYTVLLLNIFDKMWCNELLMSNLNFCFNMVKQIFPPSSSSLSLLSLYVGVFTCIGSLLLGL